MDGMLKTASHDKASEEITGQRLNAAHEKIWHEFLSDLTLFKYGPKPYDLFITVNRLVKKDYDNLLKVAPTNITVILRGETGTGKELFAQAVHNNSNQRSQSFKAINCGGVVDTLLESELFGHVRGAFTNATHEQKGLIQTADNGTLFLDEIGDMPPSMQVKLLRVLEDRKVTPVGSDEQIAVNVRVVVATNANLDELVANHVFRLDLQQRLKGFEIVLPPLRDRREDILPLSRFFLTFFSLIQNKIQIEGFTPQCEHALLQYEWPGNVRELRRKIQVAVAVASPPLITKEDVFLSSPSKLVQKPNFLEFSTLWALTSKQKRNRVKRLAELIAQNKNKTLPTSKQIAKALGISIKQAQRYRKGIVSNLDI